MALLARLRGKPYIKAGHSAELAELAARGLVMTTDAGEGMAYVSCPLCSEAQALVLECLRRAYDWTRVECQDEAGRLWRLYHPYGAVTFDTAAPSGGKPCSRVYYYPADAASELLDLLGADRCGMGYEAEFKVVR